ncbi:MAG: hypothetical protein JWP06_1103 [Candidatus Saccharibacteria bacterium]|nr:hypothetical protein [Candidatus Saccharibacteria bacterium]
MKTKLLQFFGLAIAAASLAVTFNALTVHAQGEKYIWTSDATIQASGGQYTGTTTFSVTPQHQFSGSTEEAITTDMGIKVNFGCYDHTNGRIVFRNNDKTKAELYIDQLASGATGKCGQGISVQDSNIDMDPKFAVAAQAAPTQPADCNTLTNADAKEKCVAVKSCVSSAKKATPDCEAAWNTCIANHTKNGAITDADKKICVDAVTHGQLDVANKPPAAEDKTSCAVVGIGWIICPIVSFLAQIVDASYGLVSSFLTIQPLLTTGATAGVYTAWSVMRNFANIAFVIAFLVVIFSQLTGAGLTNYGLKKMLPKLVLAAIFVNVSYWICAIAVDLSNITGRSMYEVLNNVTDGLALPNTKDFGATGTGWTGIAGGLLAGTLAVGALLYIGLSALLPALLAVLITIVTVLLVLVFRQALAILLIVVSPLAFVARLLPNTEGLFKKWLDLSQIVLIMYPTVGLVFGASALASTVVMGSANGPYKIAIQIMGAAISVIPLVVVPGLIKASKGVLGKFGGIVDNPNRGPISALKKGAEGYRGYRKDISKDRRFERSRGTSAVGRFARRAGPEGSRRQRTASWIAGAGVTAGKNKELKYENAADASRAEAQSYVANRASSDAAYAAKIAGPTGDVSKVRAAAISAQVREFNEKVGAEQTTMSRSNAAELKTIIQNTSGKETEERRSAAAGQLMKVGTDNDIHEALNYVGTQPKDASGHFADSAVSSMQQQMVADMGNRKPLSLGAGDVSNLSKGNYDGDFDSKIKTRLESGKISAEALASASKDELEKINNYVTANVATLKANPQTAAALATLQADIHNFRTNPQLQGRQPAHDVASQMDNLHGAL